MKKALLYILITGLVMACEDVGSLIHQTSFALNLVNQEGNNIFLLPKSDYAHDKIRLYYYDSNNDYTKVFDQNLYYPYGIKSRDDGSIIVMPVFGPQDGTYTPGGKSTTYIDFGNGDIDTIQVAGEYNESGSKIVKEVWYNNVENIASDIVFVYVKE